MACGFPYCGGTDCANCHTTDTSTAHVAPIDTSPGPVDSGGGDQHDTCGIRAALDVTLTKDEAEYIAAFVNDSAEQDDEVLRLMVGDGHSGYGLYVSDPDYPEEGAILVKNMPAPTRWQRRQQQAGVWGDWQDCSEQEMQDTLRQPGWQVRNLPRGVEATMAAELKPCPFCGGDAELDTRQGYAQFPPNGKSGTRIVVYCRDCGADLGVCREDVSGIEPEQVVEMWNSRWEMPKSMVYRIATQLGWTPPSNVGVGIPREGRQP